MKTGLALSAKRLFAFTVFFTPVFLFALPLHALDHSGGVVANATWYAADNPHVIVGTVTVAAGVTLTVEDGAVVQGTQFTSLTVQGTLNAIGTAGTGILFTEAPSQTFSWYGVRFNSGGTGTFEHCTIELATDGLRSLGSVVQLASTTVRNNAKGFYGDGVTPTFLDANNVFENNDTGIYLENVAAVNMTATATIRNNTTAGIEIRGCNSPTLDNLTLTGNAGTYGAVYAVSCPDFTLGAGNTIGGSGLENSWPVTIASDSYPSVSCSIPSTGNTNNAIQVVIGSCVAANTWRNIGVEYVITGSPIVSSSGSLTIEDGVVVRAYQLTSLSIEGTLTAVGSPGTGILFTQVPSQTFNWYGLRFNGSGSGTLAHCTIEEADDGVRVQGGFVQLTSTTFRNNKRGYYSDQVLPTFLDANTVFEDNETGVYLENIPAVNLNTAVTIRGNTTAGIELRNCTSATVDNLTLTGNAGTYGAIYAIYCGEFTVGGGNTIGGSGLENSWPVTIAADAYPSASSTIPPSGNTNNTIQVVTGTSSGANTWRDMGVQYELTGSPTVSASGSLTIEDGVVLRAHQYSRITVEGALTAIGTPGTGILFTQVPSQTFNWYGLRFSGGGTGTLAHCTIEEADDGMRGQGGPVQLTSTTFRNNSRGYYSDRMLPTFLDANSVFEDNQSGLYLQNIASLSMTAAVTIRGSATAGIELRGCSAATLDNLTLTGNAGNGAIYAAGSPNFTLGAGNTIGGSGLENNWPLTIAADAYPSSGSTLPSSGNTNNAIQVLSGPNNSAITWPNTGIDYVLSGSPIISASGSLTIADGVVVRANQFTSVTVQGTLTAIGTSGAGILFTQVPSQSFNWFGVQFNGGGTGTLVYCTIEEADHGLYVTDGTVELDSTTVTNNKRGISASGGTIVFRNNRIINNTDYGIYLSGASPDFGNSLSEWNDIYGNGTGQPGRDLRNGPTDIDAQYVYWGTIVETEIQNNIWDKVDDSNLGVVNFYPSSNETHDVVIGITDSTNDEEGTLPTTYALSQNQPNPFNPTTVIRYDLPRTTSVQLRIYDVSGRLVRALLDGDVVLAGRRHAVWNGKDDEGHSVASGVYFYRITAGEFRETKRMVLVR